MTNVIYGLVDPITNDIRYIGKSTSGLRRAKDHLKPHKYNTETNYKANWIKKLAKQNLKPEIIVIEWVKDKSLLSEKEKYYISEFRKLGYNLTNLTDGGEGSVGRVLSKNTKQKISEKRKQYYSKMTIPIIAPNRHVHINNKKLCGRCDTIKDLSLFGKSIIHWDKLTQWCKECRRMYARKYRIKRPDKRLTPEQWQESYKTRQKKNQYTK